MILLGTRRYQTRRGSGTVSRVSIGRKQFAARVLDNRPGKMLPQAAARLSWTKGNVFTIGFNLGRSASATMNSPFLNCRGVARLRSVLVLIPI